jgi:hypothetical protein
MGVEQEMRSRTRPGRHAFLPYRGAEKKGLHEPSFNRKVLKNKQNYGKPGPRQA